MKVRNGFVSNSSSSSFVVYGTCLSEEEIRKCFGWDDDIEEDEEKEFYELLDEKIGEEYTWTSDEDSNEIYIGIELKNMKEDETLKQFKERVSDSLKKTFNDDVVSDLYDFVITASGSLDWG